jgi:neutral ceramidase
MTGGWQASADSPLLGLGRAGRARFTVEQAAPAELDHVSGLLAGATEVDITPPPGMPKAGYSANANDGAGFRTRLRARVLHLRAGSASIAFVQCDLLGGSAVLQHLVARAVADRTDLSIDGLLIGATHTHAGPGQFLGSDFYNRFASNRPGFDAGYTQFLVEQISGAVLEAVLSRRPARLATGSVEVWGWTRNRSLAPHLRNDTVTDKSSAPHRKFAAINPDLHMVRVDDLDRRPLAAMVLFSVHGTGISMRSAEYNADLWAYVTGTLADEIEKASAVRPIVGAVQATHADVAPAIRPKAAGYLEAERVGAGIGREAMTLWSRLESKLAADVAIDACFHEADLDTEAVLDGVALPPRAAVGAALVAGAHEHTTPIINHLPPFRAGTPRRHDPADVQGAKWVLGSRWLQPVVLPAKSFPRIVPIHLLRMGDLAVLGLPFEVTVETGRRLARRAIGALAPLGVGAVTVSSVANEYIGYVTTAEEYALQYYEGGHTLYGPTTAAWLEAQTGRIAALMASPPEGRPRPRRRRSFDLKVHGYLAQPSPARAVGRHFVGRAEYFDAGRSADGYWQLAWHDVAPGNLAWHQPLVTIERQDAAGGWARATRKGRPVDDQGWDVEVRLAAVRDGHKTGPGEGVYTYLTRWHDPALGKGRHKVVLVENNGRPELASQPFG